MTFVTLESLGPNECDFDSQSCGIEPTRQGLRFRLSGAPSFVIGMRGPSQVRRATAFSPLMSRIVMPSASSLMKPSSRSM